ncbi:hypothetical protein [Exiguobacterium sp. S90]|uniref:TcaA second domain-containing protein n=1 Tax=Exiguobacterium sp. S90 TaxID=1221231 RepID=UPI001BE8E59B|nr:hypothetical protein [Exiguobacterium sp. S90]
MPSRMTLHEQRKKRNQRLLIIGIVLLLVAGGVWGYVSQIKPAAERERTEAVFVKAVNDQDRAAFQKLVYEDDQVVSIAEATRLMKWFQAEDGRLSRAAAEIKADQQNYPEPTAEKNEQDLFELKKTAGRFWYDEYVLHLNKQLLQVTSDVPETTVFIDDEEVGVQEDEPLKIKRFPGEYDVLASVEANGKTGRDRQTVQLGDEKTTEVTFKLAKQIKPDVTEQYGLDIEKLLETEVEARTGKSIDTMTTYLGGDRTSFEKEFGPPVSPSASNVANRAVYDGFEVTYANNDVKSIMIDLNKTPSELEAVAGKPESKSNESIGTVWEYPTSFFEDILGWLNLRSEKRVIERSDKMWLELR